MVSIDASGVEACLLEADLLTCKDADMEFDTVRVIISNVPKASARSKAAYASVSALFEGVDWICRLCSAFSDRSSTDKLNLYILELEAP